MTNKTCPLQPGAYYHVYNRAHGNEKLFLSNENYRYFLRRFQHYITPIAQLHCYCLMPNHFHFLIEIKDEHEIEAYFLLEEKLKLTLSGLKELTGLARANYFSKKMSLQFSHFFNSYTQALNKQQVRKGSLFMRPFKRKEITNEKYLLNLIRYIHQNPIAAGLTKRPEDWPHSSYHHILANSSPLIHSRQIIEWFNDKINFSYCHNATSEFEPDY